MQSVLAKGKWALLVVALIVGAAAAIVAWKSTARKPPSPVAAVHAPAPTELNLPGRIQAQDTIAVPAPISGIIESYEVDLNQEVFEGQILARISSQALAASQEAAAAEVEGAQSRLNNLEAAIVAARLEASRAAADASRVNSEYSRAQKNYEHQKLLWSAGATPRLTYEKSESDFQSIEQQWTSVNELARTVSDRVDSLQKEYDNTKKLLEHKLEQQEFIKTQLAAGEVHSPVNGVVVGRHGEAGTTVDGSVQDLFQIATDLTLLQVVCDAGPETASRLRAGQNAMVYVAELPNDALPGVVRKIDNGQVIVEFTSPNPAIKPGLTAQARIRVN